MRYEVRDCDDGVVDTAESFSEAEEAREWHSNEVPWGSPYSIEATDPERTCPECDGRMRDRGDCLQCRDCGWLGVPCFECDGWVTDYLGIQKGDHVSECSDCGNRFHTAANWWEIQQTGTQ